jgi:tellurite resistance protein TerC
MTKDQIVYLVFGIVLVLALLLDLVILNKKDKITTMRQALIQTLFWVGLALSFGIFIYFEEGEKGPTMALEYISAYLMEWSLSVDNIFVFILIFTSFNVKEKHYGRVLLIGILMAIIFRALFITVGVALVDKFHWVLYLFGVFLVYTGYHMFTTNDDEAFEPHDSKVYKFLNKFLPLAPHDGDGKYVVRDAKGKPQYTTLFVVVVMLAAIDLVFALDSIPAVMGISREKLVIYTSNIFAVLGLRSLFFLLRGAVSKFDFLQQGIAIVLVFIGIKMLAEHWINEWIPSKGIQVTISLGMILLCIGGSIVYSIYHKKKYVPHDLDDNTL